ncbi:MAG: exodeoxyribonuclease III [Candidatus Omnitrophica bacterium]|nr:exodeoxyribonuclease III [Candidatus Omnitrophota bacterium]
MKLISWNVNGIRAISNKGFWEWFKKEDPDILCLQETKAEPIQLSPEMLAPEGFQSYWAYSTIKKGYSGVAVFSKIKPNKVTVGLGNIEFDVEGRVLMLEYDNFILFNIYFPNGGAGNKRVPFKMSFYDFFLNKVDKLKKNGKKIIICGDVNTAHMPIDLSRPKENEKNTGFLPEEREWVSKFIDHGYIDTFRHFTKDGGNYTWWDYKTKARERNIGWRIDYFFVSDNMIEKVKKSTILNEVLGSDHCPIALEINI